MKIMLVVLVETVVGFSSLAIVKIGPNINRIKPIRGNKIKL